MEIKPCWKIDTQAWGKSRATAVPGCEGGLPPETQLTAVGTCTRGPENRRRRCGSSSASSASPDCRSETEPETEPEELCQHRALRLRFRQTADQTAEDEPETMPSVDGQTDRPQQCETGKCRRRRSRRYSGIQEKVALERDVAISLLFYTGSQCMLQPLIRLRSVAARTSSVLMAHGSKSLNDVRGRVCGGYRALAAAATLERTRVG